MRLTADWLTDEMADRLIDQRRPHPTIPDADLAEFHRALTHVESGTRCHLLHAERLKGRGNPFAQLYRDWQARSVVVVGLRTLYSAAHMRREHVDLAEMWRQLRCVRAHFIGADPSEAVA